MLLSLLLILLTVLLPLLPLLSLFSLLSLLSLFSLLLLLLPYFLQFIMQPDGDPDDLIGIDREVRSVERLEHRCTVGRFV